MTPHVPDAFGLAAGSSKIGAQHRERLAVVYVRQSTAQQVLHHQESTRLQYNLTERAVALGWPRERVLVIDDDLGRSGASAEGRPGFQRLVAEVGLDHVGLILGVEVSRLARSCRDWHQLLEVCSLFGALISDLDGVYDPSLFNDRLLLGLKGTMSEAELHTIKMRMHAGRNAKAARGELGMLVPVGYVRRPSGEVIQDPDEQARTVVETIFAQFERRGTVHGVLCYLVEHDLRLPVRVRFGPDKGDLTWTRPNRVTLQNMLANPIYAGAYVWGRRPTDARAKRPGRPATGRKGAHVGEWRVCLRDRVPAYITWDRFEAHLTQLEHNRQAALGVVRRGASLLAGLVRCGRCGRRMAAQYSDGRPRYCCVAEASMYAGALCQSLTAGSVDRAVEALLLRALAPAALEVSLAVATDLDAERARVERLWQQRLERTQYEVDRSRRQYNAVEPENRLVVRTLERQLEAHLGAHLALQEDYHRYCAARPATLTDPERAAIRGLAADLPALWHAPSTTIEQRKAIVRQLIDEVGVTVEGVSERVALTVTWAGGHRTETTLVRPVAKLAQLSYYAALVSRGRALAQEGRTHAQIAAALNAEGWRPAKRRATFNASMVSSLLESEVVTTPPREPPPAVRAQCGDHEWTLAALAHALDMPSITLHSWVRRGWATGRKVPSANPAGQWLLWADDDELARLRARRTAPHTRWPRPASDPSTT
jgi:DNA invertase Pin-like site-specific DNA recombinase